MNKPKIQNVVTTTTLSNCDYWNLREIAQKLANVEYNPRRFSAAIIRQRRPVRSTGLIFSSGRIVCTGARSLQSARAAARHIARMIQKKISQKIEIKEYKVQNIVASFSYGKKLNLRG